MSEIFRNEGAYAKCGVVFEIGGDGGGGVTSFSKTEEEIQNSVDTSVGLTLGNHYNADWTINTFLSAKVKFMPATTTSNALQ